MSELKERLVAAVDVGYGHTKFTVASEGNTVVCESFPSLAPIAAEQQFTEAMGQRLETVKVSVDGVTYEVGPDVAYAMAGGTYSRVLDPSFPQSAIYKALVLGALYYMNVHRIRVLVLGLPFTTYMPQKAELAARFKGTFTVGNRSIDVTDVLVVAQPQGGYADYLASHDNVDPDESTLLVDPGEHTLDWIHQTGQRINNSRSGALNNKGGAAILRKIAERIQAQTGHPVENFARLDAAWREGKPFKFNGESIDLALFRKDAATVATGAVNQMLSSQGTVEDIDRIIIAGGAASIYHDALRAKFPEMIPVEVLHDPVYANVRGYQYIGEAWLTASKKR